MTAKNKSLEEKYQKLDQISHVLLRPSRYIGPVKNHKIESFILDDSSEKFVKRNIEFNPGFLKLFDEIILNSVDESERTSSKLNIIKVKIDSKKKCIIIEDNGGIPVEIHKEHKEYIPEMVFGHLMAGSNFDDSEERTAAGTHGEGASLVNIFSIKFVVETDDGKKSFKMEWKNNSREKGKPEIGNSKENGTKITYYPDPKFFEFTEDNINKLIKRTIDIAGCRPKLKIYINGKLIKIKSFKDYINYYINDEKKIIFEENKNWQIAVVNSESGSFEHVSFINCIDTYEGGTHINYISDQITSRIKEWVLKKKKYDLRSSEIKNHLKLFINAVIINPSFSSQTKENMVTEPRDYGTEITLSEKFINSIIKSDIMEQLLEWIEAKNKAKELAELKKLNKDVDKGNIKRILKLADAGEKEDRSKCLLCITEGISASLAVVSARDPRYIGSYALKGKILNVSEVDNKKITADNEFKDIITAVGLKIGEKVKSVNDLRYGKIAFLTDSDCLSEDTFIITDKGNKKLKDINPGDSALTSGGFKKILNLFKKNFENYIVFNINGNLIECSENHKFYVFDSELNKIVLKKAKDINKTSDFFLNKKQDFMDLNSPNDFNLICINDKIEIKEKKEFIDITVEENNNFFITDKNGNNSILSSNSHGAHISGLLCNLFYRFWPELFKMGVIHRFYTPIIKVTQGKEIKEFYTVKEFEIWEKQNTKPFNAKWLKGLASSTTEDFKRYLSNLKKNLVPLEYHDKSDFDIIELFFNKDKTEDRKKYLDLEEK